jgi:hypothetical protein
MEPKLDFPHFRRPDTESARLDLAVSWEL